MHILANGIYTGLRAEQATLCSLVVIAVNERRDKHCLAIADSVGESTQTWHEVLLKLKSHGLNVAELATSDGAMVAPCGANPSSAPGG